MQSCKDILFSSHLDNKIDYIFEEIITRSTIYAIHAEGWEDIFCWEDLSDVNRTINIFALTAEESSNVMTVFTEGHVEVHNPANYKGDVHGEQICVSENGGMLIISIPTNIGLSMESSVCILHFVKQFELLLKLKFTINFVNSH